MVELPNPPDPLPLRGKGEKELHLLSLNRDAYYSGCAQSLMTN